MDAYNLMLKAIEEHKTKPPYATYTEIITKLCNFEMPKEACKMFDLMRDHGFLTSVQLIYDVIVKCGTADDAYDFIKKINKDVVFGRACRIMVKAFCNAERLSEAHKFISKVPTNFLLAIIRKASGDDSAKTEVSTEDDVDGGKSCLKKRYRKRKAKKGGNAGKVTGKDELKDELKEDLSLKSKEKGCTYNSVDAYVRDETNKRCFKNKIIIVTLLQEFLVVRSYNFERQGLSLCNSISR